MSWDGYLNIITSEEAVVSAAIYKLDGEVLAKSGDLKVTKGEIVDLVSAFDDPGDSQERGVFVSRTKYMYLGTDQEQIRGRKDAMGISIVKAPGCIIIGVYNSAGVGMSAAWRCQEAIKKVADHLRGSVT
ncbi:profilin [Pseudomonas sichuanensis]|uniref:profilin n=1 Tax=Pseudomonas sichuanensis TaxID=2213015 RepID=UPI00244B0A7D|nr:profilin [Pseudomonas sichuanensis]MDH0732349.1 profilin [Pseudomonas sichuanensis]MDH1585165.1 profilin [Pseudomonas sichuanensis]MDH1595155.1 profilin [Pseudomonas sichuanensis]MDH1599794.1 profilin [Pseudomonas sichuanensis]